MDLRRILGGRPHEERERRELILRLRGREAWHEELLAAAEAEAQRLRDHVAALERSEDTHRQDLVQARRALMSVEGDVRHHSARLRQARDELADIRVDPAAPDTE